jgi:hypothetical protein
MVITDHGCASVRLMTGAVTLETYAHRWRVGVVMNVAVLDAHQKRPGETCDVARSRGAIRTLTDLRSRYHGSYFICETTWLNSFPQH